MIITEKFVVLNLPKTGSSFVRVVLKKLFQKRASKNLFKRILIKLKIKQRFGFRELKMPHPFIPNFKDQHGTYDQIPAEHKDKLIVTVIRNPYERFESQYKYKWWANNPPIRKEQIEEHFPGFPELSLDDYLKMRQIVSENIKEKYEINKSLKIGDQSIQFIRMYFKNANQVLKNLDENYIKNKMYVNDICNLTLLTQEKLNSDLVDFLISMGFKQKEVAFIKEHEKVNITETTIKKTLISQDVVNYVDEYEWILFEILTGFNITYPKPKDLN